MPCLEAAVTRPKTVARPRQSPRQQWQCHRGTLRGRPAWCPSAAETRAARSEEHTSELQSLMRISYAVFCLKKKKNKINTTKRDYQVMKHDNTTRTKPSTQ